MPEGIITELPKEFQTDFPQVPAVEQKEVKPSSFNLNFLGAFFTYAFWGILIAFGLFLLYSILSEANRLRLNRAPKKIKEDMPEVPTYQPDEETARVLLNDADALAAQGRYAEAVHILLFRSIQDIQTQRPHAVNRSLTSREISRLSILSPKAKEGFSLIGRLVENSFFGGGALDKADYETSKTAYKNFAYEKIGAKSGLKLGQKSGLRKRAGAR